MAFPRNSLRAFLTHARISLTQAANGVQKVNIVIGNESADLDSLTSSLLYAYIRSIAPPRTAFSPLYVPLLNIPASGLRLRPELTAVCGRANLPISHLITLNDLPDRFKRPENIRWILVDHNKLQETLGKRYSHQVHGVIDHHDEEHSVPRDTEPEPRIIEKCGSCTSLVVRFFKPTWDAVSSSSLSSGASHAQGEAVIDDSSVTHGWDAQIAQMALASILIDTANLTAPGKVDRVDREAVEYLESKIQMSAKDAKAWNRNDYYKDIDEAKNDIGALSLEEILTKDYKEWTANDLNLGISSVVKPLEFLAKKGVSDSSKYAFSDGVQCFMQKHDLAIFAIMTTSMSAKGEFQRELLLQAGKAASSYACNFAEQAVSALKLEALEVEGIRAEGSSAGDWRWPWIWKQNDVGQSRKQVAPLLREAMRS